jgi:sigma-B regulation protein RsbU (phosphoserine phosphatase)
VRLAEGDSLLLYTDGVTESKNYAGEEYGIERLEGVALAQERRTGREILDACLADLEAFTGEARSTDDRTVLILKRVISTQ